MQVERCSPFSIIAVTFTNKAAAEMRGRVEKVIGDGVRGMWIGTFHGIAHRLLRAHHLDAGLPQDFQILDSDDQYRLIRRVLKALNLDEKHWPARRDGLHQRQEGRGCAPATSISTATPSPAPISRFTRPIRRPAIAPGWWTSPSSCCGPRAVAQQAAHPRALPRPLPEHPGGRVPGYQRHPVRLAADAGGRHRQGDDRRRR